MGRMEIEQMGGRRFLSIPKCLQMGRGLIPGDFARMASQMKVGPRYSPSRNSSPPRETSGLIASWGKEDSERFTRDT